MALDMNAEQKEIGKANFHRAVGHLSGPARGVSRRDFMKGALAAEAVVIALPLHLHAKVAIEAMRKGKHVLCEKLMGWNVRQCKDMIKASDETEKVLTIGHQRHYSLLYAHALDVLHSGVLGDVKHI